MRKLKVCTLYSKHSVWEIASIRHQSSVVTGRLELFLVASLTLGIRWYIASFCSDSSLSSLGEGPGKVGVGGCADSVGEEVKLREERVATSRSGVWDRDGEEKSSEGGEGSLERGWRKFPITVEDSVSPFLSSISGVCGRVASSFSISM